MQLALPLGSGSPFRGVTALNEMPIRQSHTDRVYSSACSTPSSARDRASTAHYFCFVLPPPPPQNQSTRNLQDTLTDGVKELALISWWILEDGGSRAHPHRLSGRGHQITLHTPCFCFCSFKVAYFPWGIASRLYGGQTWTQRRRCETTSYHVLPLVEKGSDRLSFSLDERRVCAWVGRQEGCTLITKRGCILGKVVVCQR